MMIKSGMNDGDYFVNKSMFPSGIQKYVLQVSSREVLTLYRSEYHVINC
jgi:hypothetical protein